MLRKGEEVVVGLSGGADSVLLTYALQRYGAKVTAVHLNHLLRGEESMRDEAFVVVFCRQLDIPCIIFREDIAKLAKQNQSSIETAGRDCRYRMFLEQAKLRGAKVATAHTLSDQVETMLFRLARGSGMKGLCGIAPVSKREGVTLIRPLLCLSREEVEACCRRYGLSYVTDSTNLQDEYLRNRIRHRIVPELKVINAGAEMHFGETARQLSVDADYLHTQALDAYDTCKEGDGLSAQRLLSLHPALQSRVLALYLQAHGIKTDARMLQRADSLAQKQSFSQRDQRYGAVSLPSGKELMLRGGRLFISEKQADAVFPEIFSALQQGEEVFYRMPSGRCWIFSHTDTKPIQNVHKNLFFFCLDYDKIKGVVTCRGRMPADQMTIFPRGVSKTLKKWMNEEHLPIDMRDRLFILADEAGPILAEGLGMAQRVAVDGATRHFLIVKSPEKDPEEYRG